MSRILCKLPNASNEISGIKFTPDHGHMVSEEVPEDVAKRFASIPGYEILPDKARASGTGDKVNYAEMKVGDIQVILEAEPHLLERVMADERAARGDNPRPGVVHAVEEAKKKLEEANQNTQATE